MTADANQILAGYYADASAQLRQWILNPPGGTQVSKDFMLARAASLASQVDKLTVGLGHQAAAWTGDQMVANYRAGMASADSQAAEWGIRGRGRGAGMTGSFSLIDRRSVEALAKDTAGDLVKGSRSMGSTAKTLLRQTAQQSLNERDINKILAGGIITGMPEATYRQLRDALIKVNNGRLLTVIDKNGDPMTFDAGKYARMVAITKTREAVETGRHERLLATGINLVSITGRVSKNFCTAFLGQVFSIDGDSDKYPSLDSLPGGGPPFHPNCSKSTRAFVAELASDDQLDAASGLDDAQKLIGMTTSQAQRAFLDLQLHGQVQQSYGRLTPIKAA